MSKRGYISRYFLIIKKLRIRPYSSYEDLRSYIEKQFEFLQIHDDTLIVGFSKRTLQRDIREIRNLFGVDIEYSTSSKGYYIIQNESENMNFQRMIEAFDMFNSLNIAQDMSDFIHLEKRRPQGTENLYGILHAVKNKIAIKFSYLKFWEDEVSQRLVEPFGLKEFKNRWYVLAKDYKDGRIKSFALDRLSNLEFTNTIFDVPINYNIEDSYRYCFGIISPDDEQPQEIILSFNPFQGKYIKTLPLHDTQQVLIDTQNELRIKLILCITHDLVMELISFGDNMMVLQPQSLVDEIKSAHKRAFKKYKSN